MEDEKEDKISLLPDCLILEILSRLPSMKYVIRTGSLSKRWQHLWTCVPSLTFLQDSGMIDKYSRSDLYSFVDKALTKCRSNNLHKFEICIPYDIPLESQVKNWIRFAINRNVQHLILFLWSSSFVLNDELLVFNNLCFTHLAFANCIFNPTGSVSWRNLKTLCISFGKLDEACIQNILSGSPLLETLKLDKCKGFKRLDITSKSVKNLFFSGDWVTRDDDDDEDDVDHYDDVDDYDDEYYDDNDDDDDFYLADDKTDIIEINAPYILSLTIRDHLHLLKLLVLDVSSLVKADLGYEKAWKYHGTRAEEAEEEMLKKFILSLSHLTELIIGRSCFEVLSCLEAKGFICPSNVKFADDTSALFIWK